MILRVFVDKSKVDKPWVVELPNGTHLNFQSVYFKVECSTNGLDGRYCIWCDGLLDIEGSAATIRKAS